MERRSTTKNKIPQRGQPGSNQRVPYQVKYHEESGFQTIIHEEDEGQARRDREAQGGHRTLPATQPTMSSGPREDDMPWIVVDKGGLMPFAERPDWFTRKGPVLPYDYNDGNAPWQYAIADAGDPLDADSVPAGFGLAIAARAENPPFDTRSSSSTTLEIPAGALERGGTGSELECLLRIPTECLLAHDRQRLRELNEGASSEDSMTTCHTAAQGPDLKREQKINTKPWDERSESYKDRRRMRAKKHQADPNVLRREDRVAEGMAKKAVQRAAHIAAYQCGDTGDQPINILASEPDLQLRSNWQSMILRFYHK